MSVKLIFEYEGEDGEEVVVGITEYILQEVLAEKEEEKKVERAFLVSFNGENLEWQALKNKISRDNPNGTALNSVDEAVKETRRQINKRKESKKDTDTGGFGSFLNKF